jgi:hypothetical protein
MMGENKKMGDFIGNTFGDNVNFQGDNVTLTKVTKTQEFNKAYEELLKEISTISDGTKKDHALFLAEELKEANEKQDTKKRSKVIGLLSSVLTHSASLAQIASLFDITI